MSKYGSSKYAVQPLDFANLKTVSLRERGGKVKAGDFASVYRPGTGIAGLLDSLPHILAGDSFRALVAAIALARVRGRAILWGMGGHVIKCGLAPVLIDLMRRGYATGFALNGSGAIHDFEIALAGQTSEDVEAVLPDGRFGAAEETGREMNLAITRAARDGIGIGESLGRDLDSRRAPREGNLRAATGGREAGGPEAGGREAGGREAGGPEALGREAGGREALGREAGGREALGLTAPSQSLLLAAWQNSTPVTVHVAIGTDTPHMHPAADPAAIGAATHQDFRLFAALVAGLNDGGVYLNVGSAVLLPEVFLKAVSAVRNLGHPLAGFTTANFDFVQHYRPRVNVVERPHAASGGASSGGASIGAGGGKGYAITGHHELMIPLLAAALIEKHP